MQPRPPRRTLLVALASICFVVAVAAPPLHAIAAIHAWAPSQMTLGALDPAPQILYDGLGGRLLEVSDVQRAAAEALGATILATEGDETLYVFLVEDAASAAFEPPAHVLLRSGHEVVLAMPDPTMVTRAPTADPAAFVPRLTEASRAAQRGIQQPVRVASPIRTEPRPERDRSGEGRGPTQPPRAPAQTRDPYIQQMVGELTGAAFQPTWQTLDDFETRYAYAAQNDAATQWLLDQFLAMGLQAEFHYFQDSGTRRNVVATLPGLVDPTKVVYICGHLDAISNTPTVCAPGADDNGSGTAAVLETARVLRQYQFEYTIKFACFNNEEQGLVGSAAYAADMDAANEDIIAVFNSDMIAYRGTDPDPADFIIYTNTNSQSVAAVLETCADTYVAGLIDPIVIVEAINASDHASFWNHGYKAVCAIEEEAWGPDFCPWYHTCNDRIEQYPQDYVVHCAKANLAAVATTAVPFVPEGPYLVIAAATVDDDGNGGSSGNGDGTLNPGETVELWVSLENIGSQPATSVSGALSTSSPRVTLLDAGAAWNDIPAGQAGTNLTALRFLLAADVGDGEVIPFTLTVTDASGSRPLPLQLIARAPDLDYYTHRLDDSTTGNGNGVIDPGEIVQLVVRAANLGGEDALQVTASLSTSNPRLEVIQAEAGAGAIPSNTQADLLPAFRVAVSAEAAVGEVLFLDLSMTAGLGYQANAAFPIKVGTACYDEVEFDGPWTLGAPDDNATTGQWVRGDPVGTLQNGQPAQTEDDHTAAPGVECFVTGQGAPGGAAGAADVDGGKTTLISPIFDLTRIDNPQVTYWRWYTNNLGNNPNGDEWVVQASSDNGTSWVDLERTTASANVWTLKSFDLEGYIVPSAEVVFRFIASDLSPGSLVEAAIDDFEISGTPWTGAVESAGPQWIFALERPRPNPAGRSTALHFTLPSAGEASLRLFTADGRLARTLFDGPAPAGARRIDWDGRDDAGRRLPSGVYFCRLEAGGKVLARRLVLAP
jgi:hypothetical protein